MNTCSKKALIVATVIRFLGFEKNDIKLLKELGYEVHCATNLIGENEGTSDIEMIRHQIDFSRSPFSKSNLYAYKQLKTLLEKENFDLVHCHTPVGGVLARIASKRYRKNGMKVIYTAHGFHFFKGAPIKNWILFYPIEKILSKQTDVIITINKEDYELAKNKFNAKQVTYIPGIGVDTEKFAQCHIDIIQKRKELGVGENVFILLSVGELSKRKNHRIVIEALEKFDGEDYKYFIAGEGELHDYFDELIKKKGLNDKIELLGYRNDIREICQVADLFIFPSLQEGLPVALMEAMASGLPCVVSNIRGNRDLVQDGKGTRLFSPQSVTDCERAIRELMEDDYKRLGEYNRERIKEFDIGKVEGKMREIYTKTENHI